MAMLFGGAGRCAYAGLTECVTQARSRAFLSEAESAMLVGLLEEAKASGVYPLVQLGEC